MRRPTDLPRRRTFGRLSGRIVLIVVAVLLFALIIFGRALARFYVDYLWHDSLGRSDVFWGVLWTKVGLFLAFLVVFLVLAGLNLYIADRTAPKAFPANVHPYVERFHEVFGHRLRLVRYCTAAVLALFLALPAAGHWQDWMLFRNSTSFGVEDAQFRTDVSFYVFELPFISFAIDWLFAAMVVVLLLTLAAHLLNGGVLFASSTPSVRASTKAHLAVLLAVLATLKAADYWLTRYQLTNERRGFVQGATYAVVKAQLPALMLLVLIALLTAGLFLSTIRTNRWRIPLVASALWLVVLLIGGLIFPALVQSLVVRPNQADREAPYIERNVIATRQAMGLGDVVVEPITFGTLTASEVESDLAPLRDVRLLNPVEMKSRFRVDEGQVAGLAIDDLDVDRYVLEGQSRGSAHRRPRARSGGERQSELAGTPSREHPRLRRRDGAGEPGHHADRSPRLPGRRADETRAVLQPEPDELCHRPHRRGRAWVRRRHHVRGHARCPHVVVRPTGGVRAGVSRLQRRRIRGDQPGLADVVGARCSRPGGEARAIPVVRRRSVSSGDRRCGHVGPRRVHVDRELPVRPTHRQRRADHQLRDPPQRQLRPQQREGHRRRLRRFRHVLRGRRRRPDPAGVAVGVPRSVHADRRDAAGATRTPPLSRRPVPGADRSVLQVPADAGELLPARGSLVGGAGAERRHRGSRRRRSRATSRRRPSPPSSPPSRRPRASCRTTRSSATG